MLEKQNVQCRAAGLGHWVLLKYYIYKQILERKHHSSCTEP